MEIRGFDRPVGDPWATSNTTVVPVEQRQEAQRTGAKGDAVTSTTTGYRSPLLLVRRRPPLESSAATLVILFSLRCRRLGFTGDNAIDTTLGDSRTAPSSARLATGEQRVACFSPDDGDAVARVPCSSWKPPSGFVEKNRRQGDEQCRLYNREELESGIDRVTATCFPPGESLLHASPV